MRLSELDYDLPQELIAQEPIANRDDARLEVVTRQGRTIEHSRFYKLANYLREGDLLILNNTRVFPARVKAKKQTGGGLEMLMVRPIDEPPGAWVALIRSHRPLKNDTKLILGNGCVIRLIAYQRPGRAIVISDDSQTIEQILSQHGSLALPHYIRRKVSAADEADYQTVYAEQRGAIAAPTAGLHFTEPLLDQLGKQGVRSVFLTLHIGPGTFVPIRGQEVETHTMESEWYAIPDAAVSAIEHAQRTGGRIIAVGTSTARALESYAITGDLEGFTGLFIYPGFRFRLVEAMITNFHMPRSTVLALVMALAGRDLVLQAYREAIRHRYRFLSYGDAMLIV
jgi:S-adenosylmethionine:tRNA ribosyltransferase-isomerase